MVRQQFACLYVHQEEIRENCQNQRGAKIAQERIRNEQIRKPALKKISYAGDKRENAPVTEIAGVLPVANPECSGKHKVHKPDENDNNTDRRRQQCVRYVLLNASRL